MARYIVTDLTRFNNPDTVCTAVVDMENWRCLRPMPYFESSRVAELNMHPGAILEGELTPNMNVEAPHVEDASIVDWTYVGPATGEEFEAALENTMFQSVAAGFGFQFANRQKHIPVGTQIVRSIITIKIDPNKMNIHEDTFKPGKIKTSFYDKEGHYFSYLSITDRGFFDYAMKHQSDGKIEMVQKFIKSQEYIYLRLGLSRQFQVGNRDGYWLQVNGIYTFPDYFQEIREY